MPAHEQESASHSQETETYSDTEMSPQAASEAVAIANQQEWSEKVSDELTELLNDIDQHLESEELVKGFKQKGGQ